MAEDIQLTDTTDLVNFDPRPVDIREPRKAGWSAQTGLTAGTASVAWGRVAEVVGLQSLCEGLAGR